MTHSPTLHVPSQVQPILTPPQMVCREVACCQTESPQARPPSAHHGRTSRRSWVRSQSSRPGKLCNGCLKLSHTSFVAFGAGSSVQARSAKAHCRFLSIGGRGPQQLVQETGLGILCYCFRFLHGLLVSCHEAQKVCICSSGVTHQPGGRSTSLVGQRCARDVVEWSVMRTMQPVAQSLSSA